MAEAASADRRLAANEDVGPLTGIPVSVKDNLCTAGLRRPAPRECRSCLRSPVRCDGVARLRAAGMPILGKTNMDEFAMGSSTENSAFGPTRNPWDFPRVPGGSSGGPRRRSPPARPWSPWGATRADRSASLRPSAAWWALSPPTAGVALRPYPLRVLFGSGRSHRERRARRGAPPRGDCRRRPARFDVDPKPRFPVTWTSWKGESRGL